MGFSEELLHKIQLDQIQQTLDGVLEKQSVSFEQLIKTILKGDFYAVLELGKRALWQCLMPGFLEAKQVFLWLFLLLIASVLLYYVTQALGSGQVGKMAYDLLYLLCVCFLLRLFDEIYSMLEINLLKAKEFMTVLVPAYSLTMAFSGGAVWANVNYEVFVCLLIGVDYIVMQLLLPLTKSCFYIGLINGFDEKGRFGELWKLFMKLISWGMKLSLSLIIAVSSLCNFVAVPGSKMQMSVIKRLVKAIPGIGDLSEAMAQLYMSSAVMIRNGIGVAAILVLILLALRPAISALFLLVSVRLGAVCSHMMGQTRLSKSLSDASKCGMELWKIYACIVLIFSMVLGLTMQMGVN